MIYLYLFGTCFHFIYVFMIIGKKTSSEVVGLENLTTSELYYFRKLAA